MLKHISILFNQQFLFQVLNNFAAFLRGFPGFHQCIYKNSDCYYRHTNYSCDNMQTEPDNFYFLSPIVSGNGINSIRKQICRRSEQIPILYLPDFP